MSRNQRQGAARRDQRSASLFDAAPGRSFIAAIHRWALHPMRNHCFEPARARSRRRSPLYLSPPCNSMMLRRAGARELPAPVCAPASCALTAAALTPHLTNHTLCTNRPFVRAWRALPVPGGALLPRPAANRRRPAKRVMRSSQSITTSLLLCEPFLQKLARGLRSAKRTRVDKLTMRRETLPRCGTLRLAPSQSPILAYDIPTFATWGVDTLWHMGYTVGGSGTKWGEHPKVRSVHGQRASCPARIMVTRFTGTVHHHLRGHATPPTFDNRSASCTAAQTLGNQSSTTDFNAASTT